MSHKEDWKIGRKEILCVSVGSIVLGLLSFALRAAPPWWFLPLPRFARGAARQFD